LEFLENVDVAVRTNLKVGMAATKRFALVSDEYSVEDAILFGSPQTSAWFDISSFTCDGCTLGKLMCHGEEKDVVLPFWGKRSAQSVREQRLSGFLKDLAWMSYPGKTLTQ